MPDNRVNIANLELQITTSSTNAVRGLDTLERALKRLKETTTGGLGLTRVTNQITALGNAIKAFPKLEKFEQLRDILAQIKGIGNIDITRGVSGGNVDRMLEQQEQKLQQRLQAQNDKTLNPQKEKQQLTGEEDKELEQVDNQINETNSRITELLQKIKDLRSGTSEGLISPQASTELERIQRMFNLVAEKIELLKKKANILRGKSFLAEIFGDTEGVNRYNLQLQNTLITIENLTKANEKRALEIERIRDAQTVGHPKLFSNTSVLDTSTQLDFLRMKLTGLIKKFQEFEAVGNTDGMARIGLQIDSTRKKIEKLEKELEKSKETVKDTGEKANKSSSAIAKFVKSFGRIAFYRAVRSILKELVSAFKEGINNLYQFSKETDGTFAQAMDKIATAMLSIRNGIGVALAPFIEALAPAIERLSDAFMEFGNTVSRLGAIMNGKTTYTKAIKSMKEYAEETKKAKTATQGFDQLNIANKDEVDYQSMFQEVNLADETDSTLQNLGQILKDIKEIITELASFLMPIVSEIAKLILPIIQDLIGNTVKFIQQILPLLEPIIEKVFELVGVLLQELQPALDNLTNSGTAQLLEDVFELVGIIVDILVPVLATIFELIQPIADVLGAVMQVVADIVHSFIETLKPALEEISPILQPIIEVVVNILKPVLEWIATALQAIGGLVRMISDVFANTLAPAIETVKSLFRGFFVLFTGDADLIKQTWSEIGEHLKNVWSKAWENIKKTFVGIINKIIIGFEKFVNGLIDAINWVTEKVSKVWDWTGIPSIPQIGNVTFKQIGYAQGGYGIPKGQLFIANEMGAEMVGSMNNKTAVANNQQIVEGIKQGVYEAFMTAKGGENDNQINLNVYLSGKQLKAEYDRLTNASGVRIGTGGLAY